MAELFYLLGWGVSSFAYTNYLYSPLNHPIVLHLLPHHHCASLTYRMRYDYVSVSILFRFPFMNR